MLELAAFLIAYLIGAIPFGFLVARARGVDIMAHGSGNIGATNVGRVLGMPYGILVFILDFAKGAIPVALAMVIGNYYYPTIRAPFLTPLGYSRDVINWKDLFGNGLLEVGVGLCAFLGHLFPIFLRFRGGKGVATGAGVVAVLMPIPTLAAALAWLVLTVSFRFMSLASIVAALVLCGTQLSMTGCDVYNPRNWFCLLAAVLVLARHGGNLMRLQRGTENRLKETSLLHQIAKTLHVLAVGLWFGSVAFFILVGLTVFQSFDALTKPPAQDRESWLPLPDEFAVRKAGVIDGPQEQGRRLAGSVVRPIFPRYFLLQLICTIVALVPALAWAARSSGRWIHRGRCGVLLIGFMLIVVNMSMAGCVHEAQKTANQRVDDYLSDYLREKHPRHEQEVAMRIARGEFQVWHGASMIINVVTLLMATAAMGLAASLPRRKKEQEPRTN